MATPSNKKNLLQNQIITVIKPIQTKSGFKTVGTVIEEDDLFITLEEAMNKGFVTIS